MGTAFGGNVSVKDVRRVHLSDANHVHVGRVGLVQRAVVVVTAPAETAPRAPRTVPPPPATQSLSPAMLVLTQRVLVDLMDRRDNQRRKDTSS